MTLEYNLKILRTEWLGYGRVAYTCWILGPKSVLCRSLAGNFSGLVNLLENAEVETSANRVIVHVDCRNPEIWWFLQSRHLVVLVLF